MNPKIPVEAVTNTKAATVLCTLGLPLARPGVWIIYDKEHPKSSGGTAHFLFESSFNNKVQDYLRTYNAGIADIELDRFLDHSKGKSKEQDHFIAQLERLFAEALIVYGRRFLDNYAAIVKSLREDISKFVKTGGTPVFSSEGRLIGFQDFTITALKPDPKE